MAASPPGCWHKSNGSRCTSPQNRLHLPPVVPARFAAFWSRAPGAKSETRQPHERGQENNIQEAKAR
nr:MAG TPA: hypothetical protein [Caudoviricetes sp.]